MFTYVVYCTVQVDDQIYYEACKDIARGTELLVWYGDGYIQFMGIPVSLKETAGSSFVSSEADVSTDGGDVSSSLNGLLCFALIWRCPIVAKLDSVCFILFRIFVFSVILKWHYYIMI